MGSSFIVGAFILFFISPNPARGGEVVSDKFSNHITIPLGPKSEQKSIEDVLRFMMNQTATAYNNSNEASNSKAETYVQIEEGKPVPRSKTFVQTNVRGSGLRKAVSSVKGEYKLNGGTITYKIRNNFTKVPLDALKSGSNDYEIYIEQKNGQKVLHVKYSGEVQKYQYDGFALGFKNKLSQAGNDGKSFNTSRDEGAKECQAGMISGVVPGLQKEFKK